MPTTNGELISIAKANEYIEKFLDDHYDSSNFGDVNVKSFIFDAGLLRTYLSNTEITNVKLMLGARSEGGKEFPTIIFVGYDAAGNYIKSGTNNNMVLDHSAICPPNCPTVGDAQNDTIS